MKIISKYKDFYDYIVQDHDADITYVRNIGIVQEYYDDLFKDDNYSLPYFNRHYGYINSYYSTKRSDGDVTLGNYIFGIYPFIYSQPYVDMKYSDVCGHDEHLIIILSKNLIDDILDPSKMKSGIDNLKTLLMDEFNKTKYHSEKSFKVQIHKDFYKNLKKYIWKKSCPEIFYKIKAPVFVKEYNELFNDGAYSNCWPEFDKHKYIHYIINISFQKLNKNILKYWYDEVFDINTYINIENFLWSIKQEPEAKPDNKTKIVAHGFDLRTSFRKM